MKRPRSRGGTGLGLSICSKQVGVLGGRVGALSKLDTGSIFWFCIPLRIPDPAAVATYAPRQHHMQSLGSHLRGQIWAESRGLQM